MNYDLLISDLGSRINSGVILCCCDMVGEELLTINKNGLVNNDYDIEEVKPILFPLISLTAEQRNEISKLLIDTQYEFSPYGKINIEGCDNLFISTVKQANALIKYCIIHHFDINGLIDKGLALDARKYNIY